jgi:hypothetical protein
MVSLLNISISPRKSAESHPGPLKQRERAAVSALQRKP